MTGPNQPSDAMFVSVSAVQYQSVIYYQQLCFDLSTNICRCCLRSGAVQTCFAWPRSWMQHTLRQPLGRNSREPGLRRCSFRFRMLKLSFTAASTAPCRCFTGSKDVCVCLCCMGRILLFLSHISYSPTLSLHTLISGRIMSSAELHITTHVHSSCAPGRLTQLCLDCNGTLTSACKGVACVAARRFAGPDLHTGCNFRQQPALDGAAQ